ncbi:hypothetical protein ABTY63_15075 [Streptomyces solisilvae]|uniref:hypothetical protein n=1 Tax=Streptomyces malaysiensis TaxID=92644 RepID=UPI003321F396
MTAEERRSYIRRIVDAAPPLSAEDAETLRVLIPLGARAAAERTRQRARTPRTTAA